MEDWIQCSCTHAQAQAKEQLGYCMLLRSVLVSTACEIIAAVCCFMIICSQNRCLSFHSIQSGPEQLIGIVLGSLSCLMQHCGFDPPLRRIFLAEKIFLLELTWVLIPFPKTLLDESINRGLVCAHMHSVARAQKILTFMSYTGECRQQKHTQHAPFTKTECDYLNGWITKQLHTQKSHPKW